MNDAASDSLFARLRYLWANLFPAIVGLAFARGGLIVACYGSYTDTDQGIFTDGSMLVTLVVMTVLVAVLAVKKCQLREETISALMWVCIAVEALVLIALGAMDLHGAVSVTERFILSCIITFFASCAMMYWLRFACSTGAVASAFIVFAALALSEVALFLCASFSFILPILDEFAAVVLVLIQCPCITFARQHPFAFSLFVEEDEGDFFSFSGTFLPHREFLVVCALGIGCLAVVVGFLRGYPSGHAISFTPSTRLLYGVLTIALCFLFAAAIVRGRKNIMTVGMFLLMEALACLALLLFTAFPGNLEYGAVAVTVLNAMMVVFNWYVIMAFMKAGWRDPYYYALGGWIVWLGARALSRMVLLALGTLMNPDFASAFMGAFLVASTQIVLCGMLKVKSVCLKRVENPTAQIEAHDPKMMRLMGLDKEAPKTLPEIRRDATERSIEQMSQHFMLTAREKEVLTLYALGYTQKHVAEELVISKDTAHAHIKRIYEKTDMHSRQEILDYLNTYTG